VWYFGWQMLTEENLANRKLFSFRIKILFLILIVISFLIIFGFGSSSLAKELDYSANKTDYPKKQIEWIVTYAPGGGYDLYSRAIAKILPKYLPNRVNIVIKNVAGAGGRRGSAILYRSKPDGYTLGILNPIGLITSDIVKKSTEFDITKYTYIATCVRGVPGIFVRADSEFNTIEDMQSAENVKFAVSGRGSGTWLWGKLIEGLWGVRVHMVSGYLGTTEYITALLRKDVDAFTIGFTSSLIPYFKSGEIKPLLIFSRESWDLVPKSPTLKGTPYGELEDFNNDRVIAGPPGLPDEIVHILERSLLKTLNDPELQEWSKATNNPLYIRNAEETKNSIKENLKLVGKYKNFFKDG
jgi:tripartite-type tricarboxylate transporter receptor subunit TctC